MSRWGLGFVLLALGLSAASASAEPAPGLDIRLERDPRPGALSSALAVNLKITVTERGTGAEPADDFEVYAYAEPAAGARTEIFPCAQERANSPGVPRGNYVCTVLIDHGGRWWFHSVVNQRRARPDDPPVALGRTANEFDINTGEVAPGADVKAVKGRAFEVALLWGHTAAAAIWLLATVLVGALALPTLRRRLSPLGLHRLEDRFDVIVKTTWTATGLLVGSGTYLLLNQTAYDTPFSSASINAVFRLPYGKPYFLTLAAKLSLYAVMVAASILLLREARRRLRAAVVARPAAGDDVSPWRAFPAPLPSGGRTAVAVSAPVTTGTPVAVSDADTDAVPPASLRIGAVVLLAGTVGLSLSITLLKYFHELIEAARALL